ncbi:MAG: helix-turn-helix domain-containing protein [Cytophagales bacterium]|nr:helix-turn-helix domain-containing protein [Cytophagales bacterium]
MRVMLGIKQDVVADKLGLSQQKISKIEQSETVDDDILEMVATALGVLLKLLKASTRKKLSIIFKIIMRVQTMVLLDYKTVSTITATLTLLKNGQRPLKRMKNSMKNC